MKPIWKAVLVIAIICWFIFIFSMKNGLEIFLIKGLIPCLAWWAIQPVMNRNSRLRIILAEKIKKAIVWITSSISSAWSWSLGLFLLWKRLIIGAFLIILGMISERYYWQDSRWIEFPYYVSILCKWIGLWLVAKPIMREILDK